MQPIQSTADELPSMYDEKQFKKAGFRVNIPALALCVVLLLLIARFLNLGLWWLVTRAELSTKPAIPEAQYSFLNFSGSTGAQKKMSEIRTRPPGNAAIKLIQVAAYFNFVHPAVFLVHNYGNKPGMVDLGQVIVIVPPGTSSYSVSLAGRINHEQGRGFADFDHGLLLKLLGLSKPGQGNISVTIKSPEKTVAIFIPYLVYLLVPLIALLVLVNLFSTAVFSAFFYFPLMFLLFDYQILFCRVPLSWLIGVSEKHGFSSPETWISLLLAGLFTAIGVLGLSRWKRRRDVFKESLIFWFFLLLPLFLRF